MGAVTFRYAAQVTLDGSGTGSIRIAPSAADWVISGMSVNVSTTVNESKVLICADQPGDAYIVDSSRTGSSGDTTDTVFNVPDGHCLWVIWQDGDAGATATVNYYGTEYR